MVSLTASPLSDEILYKILHDNGYLADPLLEKAKEVSLQRNIPLIDSIIENDLIGEDDLGKIIADYLKIPFVSLSKLTIPLDSLQLIPALVARSQHTVVFGVEGENLKIGTYLPQHLAFFEMVAKKAGLGYKLYFATKNDIDQTLSLYRQSLKTEFEKFFAQDSLDKAKAQPLQNEFPIAKIVDSLLEYAYEDKASDIHIEPEAENSLVRFRIDGVLHDIIKIPRQFHDQIITRIKVLARLRTDEHLSAQDGKLRVKTGEGEIDVRVSIVPIVDGEKTVLRLLSAHNRQFGLADLGMNENDLNKVKDGFSKPYGLILSTGPTGSGKTTTIYAILKILNTREKNIATIEDPVEYEIEGINQIQANLKTNLTFASGLRSILRQDPDIIYVGEIRDEETASIAINSATTGHLVLSTLHTNDAATALVRLIDMKVEPFLVSSTVNVIVAQRLIRQICDKCKVSYTKNTAKLAEKIPAELVKKYLGSSKEVRLYKGAGCPVCHQTGFVGRVGIFEIMQVSPPIQDLINKKTDSAIITQQAVKEGMTTMFEDGLAKAQRGVSTIEEVMRATKE